MSAAIGISPAIMISRKAHAAAGQGNALVEVARLRADLSVAAQREHDRAALLHPEADIAPPAINTGADVDRLV